MSELDTNSSLNDDPPKADRNPDPLVVAAPKPEEVVTFIDNFGAPLQDHEIGPDDGLFRVRFRVVKLQFQGQRIAKAYRTWQVRANTRTELLENLWQLVQPYVRRAIDFPAQNEPCWSEKEVPDRMDLSSYVLIRDNTSKRNVKLDQIEDLRWRKWTVQSNLMLIVYLHGSAIHSRAAWELAVDRVIRPGAVPRIPALVGEELKLDTMIKRLMRVHKDKLIPKGEDAFEQWAKWIIKAPVKHHSNLSLSMPPGDLMKNFVNVEQANGREKTPERSKRARRLISGPARREHTSDGFGFEDEVRILRQTVTQIRDLVEMLDHRVGLLEEKCHGFKQTVQGGQAVAAPPPEKKARTEEVVVAKVKDSESEEEEDEEEEEEDNAGFDDEPLVNEEKLDDSDGERDGKDWVNPDPLLFNDLIEVKEESYGESE